MPDELVANALACVQEWAATQDDLEIERLGDRGWFTVLQGERKRTIPFHLEVGDATLLVQSHLMRAPEENHERLYALLLRRHLRSYVLRFALSDDGDVLLLGVVPLAAVTVEEIDRLAGQVLEVADSTFNEALRLGFETYIAREQAWRERAGLPRNPIS